MNLKKLFEMQKVLDDRIVKEKGLEGVDLLPMKILALQTELGECANEWRGFKFWSEDQKARTHKEVPMKSPLRGNKVSNPLLEEYVDCLHFILSVGLELKVKEVEDFDPMDMMSVTDTFSTVIGMASSPINIKTRETKEEWFNELFSWFNLLGRVLGFTPKQVEQAYFNKNAVNHERQANGY